MRRPSDGVELVARPIGIAGGKVTVEVEVTVPHVVTVRGSVIAVAMPDAMRHGRI